MSVYWVNTIIESKPSARHASNSILSRRALLSVPNSAIRRSRSFIRSRSLIASSSRASGYETSHFLSGHHLVRRFIPRPHQAPVESPFQRLEARREAPPVNGHVIFMVLE